MNSLIIYSSEAYILMERIEEDFKKCYKHLSLNLVPTIENDLLKAITIVIKEIQLGLRTQVIVTTNGLYSISDYKDYIDLKIKDLISGMLLKYYTI